MKARIITNGERFFVDVKDGLFWRSAPPAQEDINASNYRYTQRQFLDMQVAFPTRKAAKEWIRKQYGLRCTIELHERPA